jgi:hypothetical protein
MSIDLTKQRYVVDHRTGEPKVINIHPKVKELRDMVLNWIPFDPEEDSRASEKIAAFIAKIRALATLYDLDGYYVDHQVDVLGSDPIKINNLRKMYGYVWVPSATMPNIQIAPSLQAQENAPPGSILVVQD